MGTQHERKLILLKPHNTGTKLNLCLYCETCFMKRDDVMINKKQVTWNFVCSVLRLSSNADYKIIK